LTSVFFVINIEELLLFRVKEKRLIYVSERSWAGKAGIRNVCRSCVGVVLNQSGDEIEPIRKVLEDGRRVQQYEDYKSRSQI
jgi:hypothetical protein